MNIFEACNFKQKYTHGISMKIKMEGGGRGGN
jgi:hypothetical protein